MHLRTVIKDQQTNKKRNKGQEEQILKQINKRENTKGTKVINHQPAWNDPSLTWPNRVNSNGLEVRM